MRYLFILILFIALGCNNAQNTDALQNRAYTPGYTPPAPNTIIDYKSEPVKEDTLNHFTCTVKIVTTPYSKNGTYRVIATYGNEQAQDDFTMPRGGERLKPAIHKLPQPYSYIIGFYFGKDTTFYDYYQVTAAKGEIKMKYTKAYSFQ